MNLSQYAARHKGDTIYVLGSGPSLNHIDPGFFRDKIVIGTNLVTDRIGVTASTLYVHTHYHAIAAAFAGRVPIFTPLGDGGHSGTPSVMLRDVCYYAHVPTQYDFDVDRAWMPDGSGIVVGSTSVHGSMHLAAHMGAAFIVLVGVDCGLLDGERNHAGYVSGNLNDADPLPWLGRWENHLRIVKNKIVREYGCGVYSLNPFVNLNLEGHRWVSP